MNKTRTTLTLLLTASLSTSYAREWSMENCIKYAEAHNLTIRDKELDTRRAALGLQQSRLAQLPSINASSAYGRDYSSIVDPVTAGTDGESFNFLNLTGNADVLIFGWFARRNAIAKNKLSLEAARADDEQVKQDVALNVATGYLRALLAKEQIAMNERQIALTSTELEQSRIEVRIGTAAELNSLLLQSQLSVDSTNYLVAVSVYNSSMLDLRALLALNARDDFDIVSPEATADAMTIAGLSSPEVIYGMAQQKLGKMRSINYNIEAAKKQYIATGALRYPSLEFVTQLSTIYTNIAKDYNVSGYNNVVVPATYIEVNGTEYPVYQSTPSYNVRQSSLGEQLNNNLSRVYALSLNIPLFNGWRATYNTRMAQIAVQSESYKKDEALLALRTEVYKAYDEVKLSLQKYNAARRAVDVAQSAISFAQKRMSTGLMTTIEFLQVQNSVYNIREQMLSAKYDYILKLKIIDYYTGKDLAL